MLDPALLPLLHFDGHRASHRRLRALVRPRDLLSGRPGHRRRVGSATFSPRISRAATGPGDATAAVAARRRFLAGDIGGCAGLDATLEAMKPARELREASRQMGRQTLRVAGALTGHPALIGYLADVDAGRAAGHHGVAFGMAAGALGVADGSVAAAYLYSSTSLLVGAAQRLMRLGQLEGQRVLWLLHPVIARVAAEATARDAADMWSLAPGLELASIRHAGLDARLFRS